MKNDLKIFDKEYIYINNITNIVIKKITLVITLTISISLLALIIIYYLNQTIRDDYKWVIKYNEPSPNYDVKKIIKTVDRAERELGYNQARYHYTPHHIIFDNFFNFLKFNNGNKVFESQYKLENSIYDESIEFRYNIFVVKIFDNFELVIEITVNDKEISKDYVKKFKNHYEYEYINAMKIFHLNLMRENKDKLKNDLLSELINIDPNKINFNTENLDAEIINTMKQEMYDSLVKRINEKYELLNTNIDLIINNIKKEDFQSLFAISKIENKPIISKKQFNYILYGFSFFVISFLLSCFLFVLLDIRKHKTKK